MMIGRGRGQRRVVRTEGTEESSSSSSSLSSPSPSPPRGGVGVKKRDEVVVEKDKAVQPEVIAKKKEDVVVKKDEVVQNTDEVIVNGGGLEEETVNLDIWLAKPADYEIPDYIKSSQRRPAREQQFIVGNDPTFQRLGRGAPSYSGRGRGGPCRGVSGGGVNGIGSRNSQPIVSSNKSIVNSGYFQKSKTSKRMTESWDAGILEGVEQVSLTDLDFFTAVNTPTLESGECQHVVIHTSCACQCDRMLGVCINCYTIFCDPPCLKNGLSKSGGRVGLASKEILDAPFGIAKATISVPSCTMNGITNSEGRVGLASSKEILDAPSGIAKATISVPSCAMNGLSKSEGRVELPSKEILDAPFGIAKATVEEGNNSARRRETKESRPLVLHHNPTPDATLHVHLPHNQESLSWTTKATSKEDRRAMVPVGQELKVEICQGPTDYGNFFVLEEKDSIDFHQIQAQLERCETFDQIHWDPNDVVRLKPLARCCVRHPLRKRMFRGVAERYDKNNKQYTVRLLDTGEKFPYIVGQMYEMPVGISNAMPLAIPCMLPVKYLLQHDAHMMQRLLRLNIHDTRTTLRARVVAHDEGKHVVDLWWEKAPLTFVQALLQLGEAEFAGDQKTKCLLDTKHQPNNKVLWKWRQQYHAMYQHVDELGNLESKTKDIYFQNSVPPCLMTTSAERILRERIVLTIRLVHIGKKIENALVFYGIPKDEKSGLMQRKIREQMDEFIELIDTPVLKSIEEIKACESMLLVRDPLPYSDPRKLCVYHRSFTSLLFKRVVCVDCHAYSKFTDDLKVQKLSSDFYDIGPIGIRVKCMFVEEDVRAAVLKKIRGGEKEVKVELLSVNPVLFDDSGAVYEGHLIMTEEVRNSQPNSTAARRK